ncbi:DNA methylase [Brevundimonas phage vB_BpoS-Marchewka]|uniref:DNA methylase n=1 Tax=Brevundimonas phage vB_BpoS-Marchewka TaxID=2948604 RepID=A0A9E7N595_9CAUD|nr:DNA methylase [Brevundimonas phage vB_BpoS-Marchewka]UTC29493.1 DNA methylase [Brevundimonas phage vB_BpoS-Bambus]
MLGGTNYPRNALDFYPTPARATEAFISVVEDDLEQMAFWEPFAGNGAISRLVGPLCRLEATSDIHRYEGLDPTAMLDFFNIYADGDAHEIAVAAWERTIDKATLDGGVTKNEAPARPISMSEVEAALGFRPDCIITNPPYGKEAVLAVEKALELMEAEQGYVAMLMRHEWDTAKGRAHLIDHPAFIAKITLRFRPVWIEKKAGEDSKSPRFSYAWYVWDWRKALTAPHAKAEMYFAG